MSRENLAFRAECEFAHGVLGGKPKTIFLWRDGTLRTYRAPGCAEVGTYTQAVELADFRRDCFWTLEQQGKHR